MVTSNWLRSQLLFLPHGLLHCTNTAQYCHGGDLVHALDVCLGQAQSQNTSYCKEAVYNHWTGLVDWSGGTKQFFFAF